MGLYGKFTTSATILNGQTTSQAISIQGYYLAAIIFPALFTGSKISFQASIDKTIFKDCYNSAGTKLEVTATLDSYVLLAVGDFGGLYDFKIVSDSSEVADRNFELIFRKIS